MKASSPDQTWTEDTADRRAGVHQYLFNTRPSENATPPLKLTEPHQVGGCLQFSSLSLSPNSVQLQEEKAATMAGLGAQLIQKQEKNGEKYIKRNTAVPLTGLNLAATWFFTFHHSHRLLLTSEGKDFKVSSTQLHLLHLLSVAICSYKQSRG